MPMSTEIKLTKDDEADYIDSTKYRGEIMTQMLNNELQQTIAYSPKLSNKNPTPPNIVETLTNLESYGIHEGRSISIIQNLPNTPLSYGMFLTRVFRYLTDANLPLRNSKYLLVPDVMAEIGDYDDHYYSDSGTSSDEE
ncbi:hypothetical protein Tco_0972778 [Tanacetum coccineum]